MDRPMNLLRHCQCSYTEEVLVALGALGAMEAAEMKVEVKVKEMEVEKFVLS